MPTAAIPAASVVDPHALLAVKDLELRTRVVMEGVRSGLHRSPFSGFSAEFTEYRQYSIGDDLRFLDWRAFARSDRYYIKKFEDETNLRALIVLDISRSMNFGSAAHPKIEYARTLAATLARFLHEQRDVVGLALFDQKVQDVVAPRWRSGHLQHIYATLSREPSGRDTGIGAALAEVARLCRKRTLVLLISDFLAPVESWATELGQLAAARHDVRALQVLDPVELNLKFGRPAVWQDLESGESRYVDPAQARADYQKRIETHLQQVTDTFDRYGILHHLTTTDLPMAETLVQFLQTHRGQGRRANATAPEAQP
jgi:uncharacterized protein (DUF58 family)